MASPLTATFKRFASSSWTDKIFYRYLPIWCVAIMALLIVMAYGAFQRDLYTDEAFSTSYTTHASLGALLEDVRKNEQTPPVYFVLVWLWARLVGQGEIGLRMLSLLFGLAAAFAFATLARRWLAPAAAVVAGTVFATAPVVARYLVEIRGYTLLLLLAVLCIGAFERVYREPGDRLALAGYTLVTGILFLTSYFAAALILAHNLIWLFKIVRERAAWRRLLLPWCLAQLSMALLALPWLPSLLYQLEVSPASSPFGGARPYHYFWLLLMPVMASPPSLIWFGLWLLLGTLCLGLMLFGLLRSSGPNGGLVWRVFGVPALPLFALIVWMQAVGPRYTLVILPGAILAMAAGWDALRRRTPRAALAIGAFYIVGLLAYRVGGAGLPAPAKPWTALVPQLAARVDPAADAVVFQSPVEQRTFEYYYGGPPLNLLGAYDYDEFYYVQRHSFSAGWSAGDVLRETRGRKRIWLFNNAALNTPRLELALPALGRWRSDNLDLVLYEAPAAQSQ